MSTVDTFTRADSTSTLGTTESGGYTYGVTGGTFGISSNKAYCVTAPGSVVHAYVDTGSADGSSEITMSGVVAGDYLIVVGRFTDASNHYRWEGVVGGTMQMYKVVGGTGTAIGAASAASVANGDRIGIACTGTTIEGKINGSVVRTITDATITTGSKWGFTHYNSSGQRYDDFAVGIADTTDPVVSTIFTNGTTTVITYTEPLEDDFVPLISQYTVKANSVVKAISNVAINQAAGTVTLTHAAVAGGQTVTVSYSK